MKKFLKPKISKFIIPSLLVLFVFVIVVMTQTISSDFSNYNCQVLNLKNYVEGNELSPNIVSFETSDFKTEYDKQFIDNLEKNRNKINFLASSNSILNKINPLYDSSFGFPSSQQDYVCNEITKNNSFDPKKTGDFKSFNYLFLVLNLALFFIIGYILSCVLVFVYGRFR